MKKYIKFIILSTIVFIFGFYIVLNNINVNASTYYDTITTDELTKTNGVIRQHSDLIQENAGTKDADFMSQENKIYKPTKLFYTHDNMDDLIDTASQYKWENYSSNITINVSQETNQYKISVSPSTIYHKTTDNVSNSYSGYHITIEQISIIENIRINDYWDDCYTFTTLESNNSSSINFSSSKSSVLVLIRYQEYDYRGVALYWTNNSGLSAYEEDIDYECYLLAYISLGTSLENNGKYISSKNLSISNANIEYYGNNGLQSVQSTSLISSNEQKTLSEIGKYKITKYLSSGAIDKTFYLYIVKNKTFKVLDESNEPITLASASPSTRNVSNSSNVKLKFNTSLHLNYLKEIIDNISFVCDSNPESTSTYSNSTKNDIIEGNIITLNIASDQIYNFKCMIDNELFFTSYQFTIDTESPIFQFTPLENQEIIYYLSSSERVYLTAKNVRITWVKENCELKINNSTKNYNYNEENNEYYFDLTSPGNYEIKIESESGTIVKKNIYIREEVFLTGVTQNNTLYKSDLESNPYFTEISLNATAYFNCHDIDGTKEYITAPYPSGISYKMYLNGELYEPNTLINKEGEYELYVKYNIGSSFTYTFTIDRTNPYMNLEYLKKQGYGSLNSWYNTIDDNGVTYSFSYYNISEENRIGAWQYAWQRELNYFTDIIDYDPNWNQSSEKLGLDDLTPADLYTGETKIYIYKKSSGNGYVYYHQYANYLNALETVVRNSIKECYSFKNSEFNPYPDDRYFEYLTFQDGSNECPIFYMNEAYTFNKSKEEAGETSIDLSIYNGATKNKIEASGLYKVIETDKAGNSTIFFIYYQENALTSIDILYQGTNYNYNSYLFKDDITITPNLSLNTYNPNKYSILEYKKDDITYYYNFYEILTGNKTDFNITEDGIYELKIYSIFGSFSNTIEAKLYKKEIIDEIEILKDDEDEDTELLVKFSLLDPIQNKQFSSIQIWKNGEMIEFDSIGNEIKVTNSNNYEFHFTANGTYIIYIKELCGHEIKGKEITLAIGKPTGAIYKNILDENGVHEEKQTEQTIYHNNICYFRWNVKKTSYSATITNLKTNSETMYLNGEAIQSEGSYKITLKNGDNPDDYMEYFIYIDKTAPIGFIVDSLKTTSDGYIIGSNNIPTSNKITKTTYTSGNREGISLHCLEEDVYFQFKNYDSNSRTYYYTNVEQNTIFQSIENSETIYNLVLWDLAGNKTEYTLTLDYKLADFTISSGSKELSNYSYTNKPFRISSNENINIYNTTDGKDVNNGQNIVYDLSDIKQFDIKISDEYGNVGYVTIYYDNTTPLLDIYHIAKDSTETKIENKAQINNAFKITWNQNSDYTVKIQYEEEDGEITLPVYNGEIISKELNLSKQNINSKKYTITVTNKAGTEKVYYIYLCNTFLGCSVYFGSKLQDASITNFITNQTVKFVLNSGTATLNNVEYKSNTKIEEDGLYTLIITDEYGNQFEYSFEVDTISPVVELQTTTIFVDKGTNGDVSLLIDDLNAKIYQTIDDKKKEIPLGFIFSKEGHYNLEVIDIANNITSVAFIIDKTAPTYEASGFTSNPNITKSNVKFSWNESSAKATLNNINYNQNTKIEEDGIYEFILADIYGNETSFNFEIDSKMLEYIINGINDKFYSNDYVNIEFDYNKIKAKLNDGSKEIDYISGMGIVEEGHYTIILTSLEMSDKSYSIDFIIDKTNPTLELETISSVGFIEEEGKFYTNNTFNASFNELENTCFINNGLTNQKYSSNQDIRNEGSYEITLTDLAGNSTIYIIVIDKSDISFNLLNDNNESLEYKLNENSIKTKSNYYNSSIILDLPEGSKAKLGEEEYISHSLIVEEGEYIMTLTNKLGTVSEFKFIIDKTAPKISLTGLYENNKSNKSVQVSIEDANIYKLYLNGNEQTIYSVSNDGSYNIKCIDVAGNESEASFEILNREIKTYISLSQDENSYIATLNISELDNYKIFLDGEIVESLNEYNTPGTHQLEIIDEYGNSYSTQFKINTPVSPSYIFNNVMTYILIVLIVVLIIVFIVKKIKNGKKNPYLKG